MRKQLLLFTLLILSFGAYAQCPISVSVASVPDVSVTPVCKSTPVQLVATQSVGAIVTQFVWVVGTDTLANNSSTINVLANNQNVTVYMQTTTGCAPDTVFTTFPVQTVVLQSIATPISTECNQIVVDVQVVTTGNGSPSYTYELSGFGTSSDGFFNDVPQGTYALFTADSDSPVCKDTTEVVIVPFDCPPPVPKEVITPNGDGFNDTWQIANIQFYPESEVFIFDRWGQRVYHKNGYDNADGWEAKYVGVDMPVSTYYYLLEIKPENGGEEIIMRGPISVFR